MSIASQAMSAVELARSRHPGNAQVQAAADSVEAALQPMGFRDAAIVGSGNSYSACEKFTRADAPWYDRTLLYRYAGCDNWIARLQAIMPALSASLRAAGDEGAAEVADGVIESAENQIEINENVTGSPAVWWDTLPQPVKIGIGLAGAWLVLDVASKLR